MDVGRLVTGLFLVLALVACEIKTPPQQVLEIKPQQQAPGLCGTSCGEMVLRYYGVGSVAGYHISDESGGSALAQVLCEDLDRGTARSANQPRCINSKGEPIRVYSKGRPTRQTRKAFPKGTFLRNVQGVWENHGIKSDYRRSVTASDKGFYAPEKVAPHFNALLNYVRQGRPAILHVTPQRKRGGGHYLLAVGYDDDAQLLHYIDPNPVKDDPRQGTVAYEAVRSGSGWFRGHYFFTGRYLAVTEAPERL